MVFLVLVLVAIVARTSSIMESVVAAVEVQPALYFLRLVVIVGPNEKSRLEIGSTAATLGGCLFLIFIVARRMFL